MVRIGFNLLVLGTNIGDEHLSEIAKLKPLGYDGVEVPIFSGDEKRYAELGRQIADLGLDVTGISIATVEANPISPDKLVRRKARDAHRWMIDCTRALGGDRLAGPIHSPVGVFSGIGPTEGERDRCADALRAAAEYGAALGVTLSVEVINRFESYVMNTMEQGAAMMAKVGHPNCAMMYDTFHANIEERDPVGVFDAHHRVINHVHISENDRGIPGRGHVPWAETFAAFKRCNYDGWLTVEAFGRALPALAGATRVWRDLFPDRDTLFAESIRHIRRGLAGELG
jgi:D-psicose/D-tagatose/L-ribulose 3-epimerase